MSALVREINPITLTNYLMGLLFCLKKEEKATPFAIIFIMVVKIAIKKNYILLCLITILMTLCLGLKCLNTTLKKKIVEKNIKNRHKIALKEL